DTQHNKAWAAFADLSYDLTSRLEGDISLRYDSDHRRNITDTPAEFIPAALVGSAFPGQVRTKTWDDLQPQATLRYRPTDEWNIYGRYSSGFCIGRFNQTGVGAANIAGIGDLFDQETADTLEVGVKGAFMERRVNAGVNVYRTIAHGSYFFVFDPNTSTQNLGNLGKVEYRGMEFEVSARAAAGLDLYLRLGFTDSDIKESTRAPTD